MRNNPRRSSIPFFYQWAWAYGRTHITSALGSVWSTIHRLSQEFCPPTSTWTIRRFSPLVATSVRTEGIALKALNTHFFGVDQLFAVVVWLTRSAWVYYYFSPSESDKVGDNYGPRHFWRVFHGLPRNVFPELSLLLNEW